MSAIISDCGRYRYLLQREWLGGYGRALFVMLNPSTADATQDDPTIRRCIGFAKSWDMNGVEVVNLFAFRATKPADCFAAVDPVGPINNMHIFSAAHRSRIIVAAWGASAPQERCDEVTELILATGNNMLALGMTKDGHPRHPLYVRGDAKLIPFANAPDAQQESEGK